MDNELYHYGTIGQRWGFRRYQNKDGTLTPLGRQRYRELSEAARRSGEKSAEESNVRSSATASPAVKTPQSNSTSYITDEELRSRITRLQLEKQYASLVSELTPQSKSSKATKFVGDIAKKSMQQAGVKIGEKLLTYAVGNMVNKKTGVELFQFGKDKGDDDDGNGNDNSNNNSNTQQSPKKKNKKQKNNTNTNTNTKSETNSAVTKKVMNWFDEQNIMYTNLSRYTNAVRAEWFKKR